MRSQIEPMVLLALVFIFSISGGQSAPVTIINNCPYPIWPATLTADNAPVMFNSGFSIYPADTYMIQVPTGWSGRLWARTECSTDSSGYFSCLTGDCGTGAVPCNGSGGNPPVTQIEMALNANFNVSSTFDINLMNGYNIPVSVVPKGVKCTSIACLLSLKACPSELAVRDRSGEVIACKSTCLATNDPKYCCTGSYDSADTCPRSDYTNVTKQECPQAHSFSFDDISTTVFCTEEAAFDVTFCP